MKSHPVIARVGDWKGSDLLLVLSLVVAACVGTEAGGKWHFCHRSSRNVESWGIYVKTGCQKTLGILEAPVSVVRCLLPVPSCAMEGKLKSSAKSLVKSHETSEISVFKNSVLK